MRASNPKFFNDPFDCQPLLSEDTLDQPGALEAWAQVARWGMARQERTEDPAEVAKLEATVKAMLGSAQLRKHAVHKLSKTLLHGALQQRVVCLTPRFDDLLLWSHYGDAHRGICIEVDSTRAPFCDALQVTYATEFPRLNLANSVNELVPLVLLTKADCWAYEREFRLLANDFRDSSYTRCENDFVTLPPGTVTAIVLGQKCTPEQVEYVRRLTQQCDPSVKVAQMVRVTGRYRLAHGVIDPSKPFSPARSIDEGSADADTTKLKIEP